MKPRFLPQLMEDVVNASAAFLLNTLPEILKLPAAERFNRLKSHFEASFAAYAAEVEEWGYVPVPSDN